MLFFKYRTNTEYIYIFTGANLFINQYKFTCVFACSFLGTYW